MDTILQDDTPRKQCSKCGQIFLATPDFFNRNKLGKYGLQAECKACIKARTQEWRDRPGNKERRQEYTKAYNSRPGMKEWRKEYDSKPERSEKRRASSKAYLNTPEGKEKASSHQKEYLKRPEIRGRYRANRKIYDNRPEIQEKQQSYGHIYRNRPDIKAREKARAKVYRSNPEIQAKELASRKAYYQRESVKARYRVHSRHRTAIKKQVGGIHTPAQIQELLRRQRYHCYYAACGHAKFEQRNGKYIYHIEHTYPISRAAGTDIPANDIGYIVLACPYCNQSKGDKFPWEWPEGGRLL